MAELDWNRILGLPPEELPEQEKEELYFEVVNFECSSVTSNEKLKAIFRVAQEILKFKGEQVESLVSEIENLATRQGEEEAHRHQSLLEEIEVLQRQLLETQKFDNLSGSNIDTLRQELVKAELKNEQLISELQARERDLLNEKREGEKFANQVMILEREKGELRSELAILQRESIEQQEARLQAETPTKSSTKHRELIETIRHKNKHITQLLMDIESMEKENSMLSLKVVALQSEVKEKTDQITLYSGENTNFKHATAEFQERIVILEEQNDALKNQLMEMASDKQTRDEQLDQLGIALDDRLAQWQELLVQKDTELIELKQRLTQMNAQFPNSYVDSTRNHLANMAQSLENREDEIENLQQQIAQTNLKIVELEDTIAKLKSQLKVKSEKRGDSPRLRKAKQELLEAQNKIKILEVKVHDAENDAEAKAEEVTDMVIQLREYETGVFGLPEAMDQIKELQKQKKVRDKHIEQLIQAGNQLQSDANNLEEENLALREKLGLDVDAVVRVDGVLAKYKADQVKLNTITQQLEAANNVQLTLKVQNRVLKKAIVRLKTQLKNIGYQPEVVSSEEDESSQLPQIIVQGISEETKAMLVREAEILENKLQDVIDENEALRKGMHEILDSVRSHDGNSAVQIESACLERLLEALDSRHMSGWYHPAMRLQAQLNTAEGNNAALREQIRISRFNEHEATAKLHKALIHMDLLQTELQNVISASKSSEEGVCKEENELKPQITAKAIEFIDALRFKKDVIRQEPDKEKVTLSKLENDFTVINKKLVETEYALSEQKELYESDKESWQNVRKGLQNEIDMLTEKVSTLSAEVNEYAMNWKALQGDPDEVKSSLANSTVRLAAISSENEKFKRKCTVLQELEQQMKHTKDCVKEELASVQESTTQQIQDLIRENKKLEEELKIIKNIHSECFPTSELEETKLQLNQLTVKYRELLANKTSTEKVSNQLINQLRTQIEVLQKNFNNVSLVINTPDQQYPDTNSKIPIQKQSENITKEIKNHSEKMYNLVKDQLKESEDHCRDLEKQLAAMVQQNLSSQLAEAELRDQLVDSIPHSQLQDAKRQLAHYEKLVVELKAEQNKLQESVKSAENKIKALEELRHCHDYHHDALQRQVLELTAASEDKVTIGRLTRELARAHESELTSTKQMQELKNSLQKLESLCSEQEVSMKNVHDNFLSEKIEMKNKYRCLAKLVNELHQRYLGHLSLLSADTLQAMLSQAHFEKIHVLNWFTTFLSSDNLMEMLKDKLNNAEGNTAHKLQELKLRVNVQSLESQLKQTEGQLLRIEKLNTILQEELLNQEKVWEKKEIIWEQTLLENISMSPSAEEKIQFEDSTGEKKETDVTVTQPSTVVQDTPSVSPVKRSEEKATMTSSNNNDAMPSLIETENMKILNNELNQVKVVMNEQTKKLHQCDVEITELRYKVESLKKQLEEKERTLQQKEKELLDLKSSSANKDKAKLDEESTEILALKATVASLQNIVNQKEETIGRYQTLLQECRDEHTITVANLQQELTSLQLTLDKKDMSSNKDINKDNTDKSSAMKVILERYLTKVHQLEDELSQCRDQTNQLALELVSSKQQTEKWTHTAEERLKTIQEMKQRLDSARSKEDLTDSNSELIEKSSEIDELNKIISNLKIKLESKEAASSRRDRLRGELDRAHKRLEVVDNQNAELKAQVQRLRKQLTLRQSITPTSEAVSTAREEALQKKIKSLEEQISECQAVIQRGKEIHKSKCDEEFGKWEERKRWQVNLEKLKTHLKEKTSQVEALRANVERLKDTIMRLEKEKITLEGKLKNIKVPSVSQSLVDELERDRAKLQEELKALRVTNQARSSLRGSSLADVIEAQERKIVTLKVAQKGESALAEEIERLLERKSRLQQTNLRLEAQNLELKMELEKYRLSDLTPRDAREFNSETESTASSPKGKPKVGKNRADLERAVVVLKRVVERLQAENKKLHSARLSDVHHKGYVEKLQIELQSCQENYLDAVDKCSALEEQLKECKEKLSFLHPDEDLAEELAMTKAQLAQKCQLLSKVKVLLENAVIREKALKEQVHDLEKLVPPERLRGTYHERKS